MGKTIDFTQDGGFPLTQDELDYLQMAYNELIAVLGGLPVSGSAPVILKGMAVSGGGNTVANGWFVYGGELIKFTGSTVTPGGGEVAIVVIATSATPLTFDDGSTPNVIIEKTASLTHSATVTNSTHFPVSALVPYAVALGLVGRDSGWSSTAVAVPIGDPAYTTATGTIYYKKNELINALHIRGEIAVSDSSAYPTGVVWASQICNLGVSPSGRTVFTGKVLQATGADGGTARVTRSAFSATYVPAVYLDRVDMYLKTDGYLYADLVKSDTGFYVVEFNALVPLD